MDNPNPLKNTATSAPPRAIRILIINQSFWPDVVATAQQAHDLAKELTARGDQVTVIASRSLYGQAGATLAKNEVKDGITIHRVSRNLFRKRGLFTRTIDYIRFNVACAVRATVLPRHDAVICLTTPPFVALVGVLLQGIKRSRFIFWTMDLYPDLPVEAGIVVRGSLVHKALSWLDMTCLRHADCVVTLGRCMRDRILAKGITPSRVRIIRPWSDPCEIPDVPPRTHENQPTHEPDARLKDSVGSPLLIATNPSKWSFNSFREQWGIGNRFVIQYSGNFGLGHDSQTVFDTMLAMKGDDNIRWVMVGDGVMTPLLVDFVRRHDIRNVIIKPYQPRESLGSLISLGNVHLVLMVPRFEGVILPSKLYGVLAAGRPAIFVGPSGSEIAQIIREENCGVVLDNRNSQQLREVIEKLRDTPELALALGQRGRRALETKYSMRHASEAWYQLLHESNLME
jgi:glycosyltransferase involved in cell wall biosynthesis